MTKNNSSQIPIGSKEKKRGTLSKKVMVSSVLHAGILGTAVMLISFALFLYAVLYENYGDTVYMAKTVSEVLQATADVPGLVDAVLEQERENQDFEEQMVKNNPAETEGQLLNYRWYTEVDPPLAKRQDYQDVMKIIYSFGKNNRDLNGTCLMVFDKETHIASLLCDVEKFGGEEAVPVDDILWRRFEDIELDHIEEERWSLLKNLYRYMRIDPRYVVFAWYEPFPYPDDNVVVFIEADAFYTNLWKNVFSFLAVFFMLLLAVVFVMGILFRRKMNRMIVRPINSVSKAAKNYASDRRTSQRGNKYFSALQLNTGDELESLADTMAEMEKDIEAYEDDLTRITTERERLATELGIASKIQQDMLPQAFPIYPDRKEFDVYASMDPAKAVGGDFYDIFLIDDDHLALVMADVSGKGIPAALFMVISKTLIKNRAEMGGTPAQILADVNNNLCKGNKELMFVTVWMGILTLSTGEVIESNAGHENPLIKRKDGNFELVEREHELVLGVSSGAKYSDDSFTLEPGDVLFVYTDGLPDATNAEGIRLKDSGMLEILNDCRDNEPKALIGNVRDSVESYVNGAEQFDDLTMMAIQYNGGGK